MLDMPDVDISEMEKVHVTLTGKDSFGGESFWVVPTVYRRGIVRNILTAAPFSLGDEVRWVNHDGSWEVREVIARTSHTSITLLIENEYDEIRKKAVRALEDAGALTERFRGAVYGVVLPQEEALNAIQIQEWLDTVIGADIDISFYIVSSPDMFIGHSPEHFRDLD